jgi:hypothetical protein
MDHSKATTRFGRTGLYSTDYKYDYNPLHSCWKYEPSVQISEQDLTNVLLLSGMGSDTSDSTIELQILGKTI